MKIFKTEIFWKQFCPEAMVHDSGCQSFGFEEISNITYWGLLMFNSISLLLVMGAINNLKTLKENDEYMKGRRYSV